MKIFKPAYFTTLICFFLIVSNCVDFFHQPRNLRVPVVFSKALPVTLHATDSLTGVADFGTCFSKVACVSIYAYFAGDGLDSGEQLEFHLDSVNGFGPGNVSPAPKMACSISVAYGYHYTDLVFLSKSRMNVKAIIRRGSITLSSMAAGFFEAETKECQ